MAENNKVNVVLDASKIDLFETCPARYNFRHNYNKVLPITQKSRSLDIGALAHSGLAVYYRMLKDGQPFSQRMEACKMKIGEMSSDPLQSNVDDDDISLIINTIEQNLDYWRPEDENCLEILEVEQPFAYLLFEDETIRIIISGQIDLLVNYHGIGQNASYDRLPIDHKTFSRSSPVLRKSNQFINYCNVVGSNYLVVNRIGLQKSLQYNERFLRIPLSYDPVYIEDWKNNLTKMLLTEYLTCVGENYWPEKPTSCNKFNRLCEYYTICDSSGQDSKDFKLNSEYVTGEPWDVTKDL